MDIEATLLNISAKAWACTATVYMIVPDKENAKLLSAQFKAIFDLAEAAIADLRQRAA